MNTKSRLAALEKTVDVLPRCIARMNTGELRQFFGFQELQPYLDGRIVHIACDDADIAALLRAFDANIPVEVVSFDGGNLTRQRL